jgi:hypothetical protein
MSIPTLKIPAPSTISEDLEFPAELHEILVQRAAAENKTFDHLVNEMIERQLQNDD